LIDEEAVNKFNEPELIADVLGSVGYHRHHQVFIQYDNFILQNNLKINRNRGMML